MVQLIDQQSKDVVWQATSRDRLYDDMRSERRSEHIQKAVYEMFQRYPG